MSSQLCGCDPEAQWVCERHREESIVYCPDCGMAMWTGGAVPLCLYPDCPRSPRSEYINLKALNAGRRPTE